MKYFIFLTLIVIASACSHIDVKTYEQLPPLAENDEVEIYYQLPPFDFKNICLITISESGYKTDPKAFESDVKWQARKCGTNLVWSADTSSSTVRQTGYSSTPIYGNRYSNRPTGYMSTPYSYDSTTTTNYAYGIKKTSDVQVLNLDSVKKLRAALDVRNDSVVKVLLKNLNKDRSQRFSNDTFILDLIYFQETNVGLKCRPSILSILKDYNAAVTTLEVKYTEYRSDKATDLIYCGSILKDSYANIEDKKSVVKYVHDKMSEFLFYYKGGADDLRKLQKISSILPTITAEIKSACAADETSEICILKPTFDELRRVIQGMGQKIAPAHRQQFKKTEEMFII